MLNSIDRNKIKVFTAQLKDFVFLSTLKTVPSTKAIKVILVLCPICKASEKTPSKSECLSSLK
jgi:hypothetical protein